MKLLSYSCDTKRVFFLFKLHIADINFISVTTLQNSYMWLWLIMCINKQGIHSEYYIFLFYPRSLWFAWCSLKVTIIYFLLNITGTKYPWYLAIRLLICVILKCILIHSKCLCLFCGKMTWAECSGGARLEMSKFWVLVFLSSLISLWNSIYKSSFTSVSSLCNMDSDSWVRAT